MYASIDSLVDKLDRQILKYKEKHMERRNHDTIKKKEIDQEPEA